VREYIGANHEFSDEDAGVHQVELIFECDILGSIEGAQPSTPDLRQIASAWLPIAELPSNRLYPSLLRTLLKSALPANAAIYLGDVN
jgi:8-oxo-dGTP diphosphatase